MPRRNNRSPTFIKKTLFKKDKYISLNNLLKHDIFRMSRKKVKKHGKKEKSGRCNLF